MDPLEPPKLPDASYPGRVRISTNRSSRLRARKPAAEQDESRMMEICNGELQ